MMNFFGRPVRASFILPMALLAARGFAQETAVTQQAPPAVEGTAASKMAAMSAAGIHVVKSPAEIGDAMAKLLGRSCWGKRSASFRVH